MYTGRRNELTSGGEGQQGAKDSRSAVSTPTVHTSSSAQHARDRELREVPHAPIFPPANRLVSTTVGKIHAAYQQQPRKPATRNPVDEKRRLPTAPSQNDEINANRTHANDRGVGGFGTRATATYFDHNNFVDPLTTAAESYRDINKILGSMEEDEFEDPYSFAVIPALLRQSHCTFLSNKIGQDLESFDLHDGQELLASRIQQFALRLGHQRREEGFWKIMYVAYEESRFVPHPPPPHPRCSGSRFTGLLLDSLLRSHRTIAARVCGCLDQHDEKQHGGSGSTKGITSVFDSEQYSGKTSESKVADFLGTSETPVIMGMGDDIFQDEVQDATDQLGSLGGTYEGMLETEAYKWLILTLQRELSSSNKFPTAMQSHREQILRSLEDDGTIRNHHGYRRISAGRPPAVYTVEIQLSWDLISFLRRQRNKGEKSLSTLEQIITISGQIPTAQAVSCRRYLEQTWPSTGRAFADMLEKLIRGSTLILSKEHRTSCPADVHVKLANKNLYEVPLPDDTTVTYLESSFTVSGTKFGIIDVAEQIAWVSNAVHIVTTAAGLFLNTAEFRCIRPLTATSSEQEWVTKASDRPQHVGYASFRLMQNSEPQRSSLTDEEGHCWQRLFRCCAIAVGYPIPLRPQSQPGLEIPLNLMAILVNADRIPPFGNDLIIKGFSTLLFASGYEDGCMLWHLISNHDDSRISFSDERVVSKPGQGTSPIKLDDALHARHFVGWTARVRSNAGEAWEMRHLGTRYQRQEDQLLINANSVSLFRRR